MHVERPFILCFCFSLNFVLFASVSYAQRPADTAATAGAGTATAVGTAPLESFLHTRLGADSRLYNGREYIRNGTPAKGHPYFEWDSLRSGTLDYDGVSYDIPLEYDLVQDQLIIRDYSDNILISLVAEKTRHFFIGPYHFLYIGPGIAHLPEPGFYQELVAGSHVSLLARRRKNLMLPSRLDEQAQYIPMDVYFLLLNGSSYKINDEKDLLDILSDKKGELKKYIRRNRLSFRRNREEALIRTISYYQQLKS